MYAHLEVFALNRSGISPISDYKRYIFFLLYGYKLIKNILLCWILFAFKTEV